MSAVGAIAGLFRLSYRDDPEKPPAYPWQDSAGPGTGSTRLGSARPVPPGVCTDFPVGAGWGFTLCRRRAAEICVAGVTADSRSTLTRVRPAQLDPGAAGW